MVREQPRECHNHKQHPFPGTKRKRKPTNPNKHKPNKRTKNTKTRPPPQKRGNRNTKRTEKHKNKMTLGKTHNKPPRRTNHKATPGPPPQNGQQSKPPGGLKHSHSQPTPPWVPTLLLNQKHTKTRFAQRPPTQSTHQSENTKTKPTTITNKDEHPWPTLLHARVNENQ